MGNMKNDNGYTILEAVIALFIGSLMLLAIYTAVNTGQKSSRSIEKRVSAQQDARTALELMASEIQMASLNPDSVNNIWINVASCSGSASFQNYRGIQDAGANYIYMEMDLSDNHSISSNTTTDPNEIIKYYYDSSNQEILRSTNCSPYEDFLGSSGNADTKSVLVVNGAVNMPVFTYYDGSGTNITSTVTGSPSHPTAGLVAIRRVVITLVVDTSSPDASGSRKRMIYSTSVIPRNHAVPIAPF